MHRDIIYPLIARHRLGDKISNRAVYATIRKLLSKNFSIIEALKACKALVYAIKGKASFLGYICDSKSTKEAFVKFASGWSTFEELIEVCKVIGVGNSQFFSKERQKIYGNRYNEIKDFLIKHNEINEDWIAVAEILLNNNQKALIEVIDKKDNALGKLLKTKDFYIPYRIKEMAIQKHLKHQHQNIKLDIINADIGPHFTISHYYPTYKKGVLIVYNGSYCSSNHNHSICSYLSISDDEKVLWIQFVAVKNSRGYRYNTERRILFKFDIPERQLYKETKKGFIKVS